MKHRTPIVHFKEYKNRFRKFSDEEIINVFNREVGNRGWGSVRGAYLSALHDEFIAREFDFSSISDENGLCLMQKIKLLGKKIEINEQWNLKDDK